MKKIFTIASLLLIAGASKAQDFQRETNKATGLKIVKFVDERDPIRIPLVVYKYIPTGGPVRYDLGIIIYSTIPRDHFMNLEDGGIEFEDGSTISFKETVFVNFNHVGALYKIAIKHTLTIDELGQLQQKNIKSVRIGYFQKDVDRFEKPEVKKIFTNIEKQ
jgi:hypothetical protein